MLLVIGALVAGQFRRVLRCWSTQQSGFGHPVGRIDQPMHFWLLFGFEIVLLLAVASYFYSIIVALLK